PWSGGSLSPRPRVRGPSLMPPRFPLRSTTTDAQYPQEVSFGPVVAVPRKTWHKTGSTGPISRFTHSTASAGHATTRRHTGKPLEMLLRSFGDIGTLLHVGEKDGELDYVGQGRPFGLQNMRQFLQDGLRLLGSRSMGGISTPGGSAGHIQHVPSSYRMAERAAGLADFRK